FDYIESRGDADELIAEFGKSVRLAVKTESGGSAIEPAFTTAYKTTNAVQVDFTWKQLQTGDVLASDQPWLVAAGPRPLLSVTDIQPGASLEIDGALVQIVNVTKLKPADVVVLFDCQLRV